MEKQKHELYDSIKNPLHGLQTIAEVLSHLYPPVGLLKKALETFNKHNAEQIREVILAEISDGNFSYLQNDDLLSLIYRLGHYASMGTASANLRLMVRLMKGMREQEDFSYAVFNRYTKMLESLSGKEIRFLAEVAKFYRENKGKNDIDYLAVDDAMINLIGIDKKTQNKSWYDVCQGLVSLGFLGLHTGYLDSGYTFGGLYYMSGYLKDILHHMSDWGIEDNLEKERGVF